MSKCVWLVKSGYSGSWTTCSKECNPGEKYCPNHMEGMRTANLAHVGKVAEVSIVK